MVFIGSVLALVLLIIEVMAIEVYVQYSDLYRTVNGLVIGGHQLLHDRSCRQVPVTIRLM